MNFELEIPRTTAELLSAVKKHRNEKFRFGAGCTDLLMELKKKPEDDLLVINLSSVRDNEFTGISRKAKEFRLGAMATAHKIIVNEALRDQFPVLHEAAFNLASTQIRQVATIGGNICTASPSGDIACALVALNASCVILDMNGRKRTVALREFFTGVRKTVLKKTDILHGVTIPVNDKECRGFVSRFIKIGTRRSMECSVVSLACHVQLDDQGVVINAGIAIGASAPTIRSADTASDFLIGKNVARLTEKDKMKLADFVLSYASPISDVRATAWYRKEVLFNVSKALFD